MEHILPFSATEIENRLKKIPDLAVDLFCDGVKETIDGVDCIVVHINYDITDGMEIKFKSPVACTDISRLCVKQSGTDNQKIFAFADANGNDVGDINNLFSANAIVKVILDLDAVVANADGAAFVQNADTNTYLENKFEEVNQTIAQTSKTFIKTINGNPPDDTGNIKIKISESAGDNSETGKIEGIEVELEQFNSDLLKVTSEIALEKDVNKNYMGWTGFTLFHPDEDNKNMIAPVLPVGVESTFTSGGGVTFKVEDDGTIVATGTATETAVYVFAPRVSFEAGTTYIISGFPLSKSGFGDNIVEIDFYNYGSDKTTMINFSGYEGNTSLSTVDKDPANEEYYYYKFRPTEDITRSLRIRIGKGYTIDGSLVFKPMVYKETEGFLPFSKFKGTVYKQSFHERLLADGTYNWNSGMFDGRMVRWLKGATSEVWHGGKTGWFFCEFPDETVDDDSKFTVQTRGGSKVYRELDFDTMNECYIRDGHVYYRNPEDDPDDVGMLSAVSYGKFDGFDKPVLGFFSVDAYYEEIDDIDYFLDTYIKPSTKNIQVIYPIEPKQLGNMRNIINTGSGNLYSGVNEELSVESTNVDVEMKMPGYAPESTAVTEKFDLMSQGYTGSFTIDKGNGWYTVAVMLRIQSGIAEISLSNLKSEFGRMFQNLVIGFNGMVNFVYDDQSKSLTYPRDKSARPRLVQIQNNIYGEEFSIACASKRAVHIDKVRITYPKIGCSDKDDVRSSSAYTNPLNFYLDIHVTGGPDGDWVDLGGVGVTCNIHSRSQNHRCFPVREQIPCRTSEDGTPIGYYDNVLCDEEVLNLQRNSSFYAKEYSRFDKVSLGDTFKIVEKQVHCDNGLGVFIDEGLPETLKLKDMTADLGAANVDDTGNEKLYLQPFYENMVIDLAPAEWNYTSDKDFRNLHVKKQPGGYYKVLEISNGGNCIKDTQLEIYKIETGNGYKKPVTPIILHKGVTYSIIDCTLHVLPLDTYRSTYEGKGAFPSSSALTRVGKGSGTSINGYTEYTPDKDMVVAKVAIPLSKNYCYEGRCYYPQISRKSIGVVDIGDFGDHIDLIRERPYSVNGYCIVNSGSEYYGYTDNNPQGTKFFDYFSECKSVDISNAREIQVYYSRPNSTVSSTLTLEYAKPITIPTIYSGTVEPSNDFGEIGDLYIVYE